MQLLLLTRTQQQSLDLLGLHSLIPATHLEPTARLRGLLFNLGLFALFITFLPQEGLIALIGHHPTPLGTPGGLPDLTQCH